MEILSAKAQETTIDVRKGIVFHVSREVVNLVTTNILQYPYSALIMGNIEA